MLMSINEWTHESQRFVSRTSRLFFYFSHGHVVQFIPLFNQCLDMNFRLLASQDEFLPIGSSTLRSHYQVHSLAAAPTCVKIDRNSTENKRMPSFTSFTCTCFGYIQLRPYHNQ